MQHPLGMKLYYGRLIPESRNETISWYRTTLYNLDPCISGIRVRWRGVGIICQKLLQAHEGQQRVLHQVQFRVGQRPLQKCIRQQVSRR